MTIFQRLLNLDQEIEQTTLDNLIFINDLPNNTEAERKEIFNMLTTQYVQGDKISMLPQCQCGAFRSKSAMQMKMICPYCNTPVQSSIEQNIQSIAWFRCPPGIKTLMNPIMYTMIQERFSKQGWDVISWLTDQSYSPNIKDTPFMQRIRERNFRRGWNAFYEQFDEIMDFLFGIRELNQQVKRGEVDFLYYLYKRERDKIFCKFLPIPNRALFVFENTNTGIYRNDSTGKAMNYISLMLSIEKSIQPLSDKAKENRIAKLYQKLSEYQNEHVKNELSPKPGQIRRNTIATKNILAYRSVITSITGPWDYNAITVPWTAGLTTFQLHLVNKLMRRGFSLNKSIDFLMQHTGCYHPMLSELLDELVDEAPDKKIALTIQRNPSLKQGSMQLMHIGHFLKDPGNKTTGVPLPVVKAPNA